MGVVTLVGRTVGGRYRVERLAGEGGMGAVYRATDTSTGGAVAMKVLPDASCGAIDRFEREARVLASFDHPGIVRHVAHGRTEDGEPFLAMEWLDGEDLAQRLARGPLPIAEAAPLVGRVARALAEVHARGVVHRDVKPSNVFLREGSTERPVLLDFGIARRADATMALTRPGHVLGTPQYMSPEQVRGESEVGVRSDVFALGCVLFECITGRPAFVGEHTMAVLAKILLEEPPSLSELAPAAGDELASLVRAMLDKRIEGRPSSCLEVAERLAAAAAAAAAAPDGQRAARGAELTKRERRLVAVVLAREVAQPVARTVVAEDASTEREELAGAIAALGGRLTPIGASNLVVLVPPTTAATDQAASAARIAELVARALPGASVALAMGWAEVDPMPVGEVIDRAATMLTEREGRGIHVDEVSAGLLELRFDLQGEPGRRRLGAERSSAEPPRTLLGKATPCVGRDRELAVLMGIVGEVASDGVARVAHVTAPAGVGKSRLRHELCARIAREHREALVLVARAEAFRASASLDLVGQLVREAAGIRAEDGPDRARSALLALAAKASTAAESDPSEVAALLAEIASVPFASPLVAAARPDERTIGDLMQQTWLAWLRAEVAERPVVLVFEDLHWADAQTVRYVDVALRAFADRPLFVLALSRPDVRSRFPSLWADRCVQEIALPPLTPRAAERLVRAAVADLGASSVEQIVRQSEGHPLYIEEMIRAAASSGGAGTSGTVLAMIQSRVASFDATARRVMRAASVFGESFRADDVRALVGDGTEVDATLALLVEREVMSRRRDGAASFAFRHALFREAAYAMLTDEDRERAHGLAARHLEARGGADDVVLAEHYDLGGEPERAATWYASAARRALRKNDFEGALAHANAALALGGPVDVRADAVGARGRARANLGAFVEAERDLLDALAMAPDMDASRRLELHEALWFVATFRQDGTLMRRAGSEALALAEASDRRDIAAEATIAIALSDHLDGACDAAISHLRAGLAGVGERPSAIVGFGTIILYHAAAYDECEEISRKMVAVAADRGDAATQIILVTNQGLALGGQGRYGEAQDCFERACTIATKYGVHTLLARSVSASAGYPADVYDFDEVERRAARTADLGRALEFSSPRINASLDLAYTAARRGQTERAIALVAPTGDAIAEGRGFHGWIWRSRLAVLYAEIFAARGDWPLALAHAEGCVRGCRVLRRVKYRLLAEHVRARALFALGRREEAVSSARASLEEARGYPDPAMLLRAAAALLEVDRDERARSELAEAAGRIERALASEAARAAFRRGAPLTRLG